MATREERFQIESESGLVSAVYARPHDPVSTIVVAHGAGAAMEHPFMSGFTDAMNALGHATLRFNFAYAEQGKRMPDRAPKAIATWRAVFDEALRRSAGEPVWAAGKSFGGRMASMAVTEGMPASGLVFLGYPLHPPGKPERIRDAHLYGIDVPMLFLQGAGDVFAKPELLTHVIEKIGSPPATLERIEGADHSFAVKGMKRSPAEAAASLAPAADSFIRAHLTSKA